MPGRGCELGGVLTGSAGNPPVVRVAFSFRFDRLYRLAGLPFGITPARAEVLVDEDTFSVRFGTWRLATPLSNIADVSLTGPYSWVKTLGPPHLSFADRGLTCATNSDRGVCVRFHEPVSGIEPAGLVHHPAVTVTVADAEGLAAALRQRAGQTAAVAGR